MVHGLNRSLIYPGRCSIMTAPKDALAIVLVPDVVQSTSLITLKRIKTKPMSQSIRKLSLGLLLGVALPVLQAQHVHRCGTDEWHADACKQHPEIKEREAGFNMQAALPRTRLRNGVQIIPVVVHVFHNGGEENISKAQIEDALRVLNLDFRRQNPDTFKTRDPFKKVAADCSIEFRLATRDHLGRCSEGIVRHQTHMTENANDAIKLLSVWPTDRYFNIWVVKNIASSAQGTVLGYAQFPWAGMYRTDGVIMRHDMMGSIGTAANPQGGLPRNFGRVLTHEAGHWLGLYHTFQDGCRGGDRVEDTPPVAEPNFSPCLPDAINSCTTDVPDLPDQYENYMDYSNGGCQNVFTTGQRARMLNAIALQRSMLVSAENLMAAGVIGPVATCGPKAHFTADQADVCAGTAIRFSDLSYQYSGNLSYEWQFPGGVPAFSTERNPQVQYPNGGKFPVRLIVRNGIGSDTAEFTDYVQVYAAQPNSALALRESFEGWLSEDFEMRVLQADTWRRTSNAASAGAFSLMVQNNRTKRGFRYQLVSKPVDATSTPAILSFRYAYMPRWNANQTGPTNDQLSVRVSGDCGRTWIGRFTSNGSNLATLSGSPFSYEFIPAGPEAWREVNVNLSSLNATLRDNLQVMIEFVSDGGNNFYLDDIKWAQSMGNNQAAGEPASVYPNPAGDYVQIGLPASASGEINIMLRELATGRTVLQKVHAGTQRQFRLDLPSDLSAGAYLLELSGKDNPYRFVEKLMVD